MAGFKEKISAHGAIGSSARISAQVPEEVVVKNTYNPASAVAPINEVPAPRPKVIVIGLASCFGCQLQITNNEPHLMEVLEQIDLQYWSLLSSDPMPETFDMAIIEGAVTTEESANLVRKVREIASHVMAIGACAVTGGVPGMATNHLVERACDVYGESLPEACGTLLTPRPISAVVPVDSVVTCCPIDSFDFVSQLQRALFGSNVDSRDRTLCADCKRNETACFFSMGELCMGLVTRSGCGSRCVNLGRPCYGCAGLSAAANLKSSREACSRYGIDPARFDKALEIFSQASLGPTGADANEQQSPQEETPAGSM